MSRELVVTRCRSGRRSHLIGACVLFVAMACGSPASEGAAGDGSPPPDEYRCHNCNIHLVATARSPGSVALSWIALVWGGTITPGFDGNITYTLRRLDGGGMLFGGGTGLIEVVVTGLLPKTEYCFYVVAAAPPPHHGSPGDSNIACATTPPDVTAPGVVGAIATSDPASNSIRLDWLEPDDDGLVVGYEIERDAEHLASTSSNTFTDAPLSSDAFVCYRIAATDAGGNASAAALSACAIPSVPSLVTSAGAFIPGSRAVALDSRGGVHVGHLEQAGPGTYDLRHATPAPGGGAWSSATVDAEASAGGAVAVAVDAGGSVHMSFCGASIYTLRYATDASGSWTVETVDSDWVGVFSSLALDSAGKAHIGYYDHQRGLIKYATNASGSWMVSTVESAHLVNGEALSIALDAAGKAHLSYYDGGLAYATNVSGEWSVRALEPGGGNFGATSIGVDPNGHVHIVYAGAWSGLVRYATDAAGAWTFSALAAGSGPVSLAVSPDDAIHVTFVDTHERWVTTGTQQELRRLVRVMYAVGTAGSWAVYPTNAASAAPALALDTAGRAHVAFQNGDGIHHAIFSAR